MAARGTKLLFKLMTQGLPKANLAQHQKTFARTAAGLAGFDNSKNMDNILNSETMMKMDQYSRYAPAPVSIKNLLEHGQNSTSLNSFLFMRKEIPTRLANMIMEIKLLPQDLLKQRECAEILNDYIISFRYQFFLFNLF